VLRFQEPVFGQRPGQLDVPPSTDLNSGAVFLGISILSGKSNAGEKSNPAKQP